MSRFSDYLASQCGNPRGAIGKILTWAMNRINGFKKFEQKEYSEMGQQVGFKKVSYIKLGKDVLLIKYEK